MYKWVLNDENNILAFDVNSSEEIGLTASFKNYFKFNAKRTTVFMPASVSTSVWGDTCRNLSSQVDHQK